MPPNHDPAAINARLRQAGAPCAGRLHWFAEIDSTNTWLMRQRDLHARVAIAELQTAGRGRRGRAWRAPRSSSVLLSLGWRLDGAAPAGLSLVSGLAIAAALAGAGVDGVGLKWPNDIMAGNAKLGGVLTELRGGECVVGMGINVAAPPGDEGGDDAIPRTALAALGFRLDRDSLAAALIIAHCDYLARFCAGGFAPFADEWNALNVHRGEPVAVASAAANFTGIARGVDASGALLVERDGACARVLSGSVRGVAAA